MRMLRPVFEDYFDLKNYTGTTSIYRMRFSHHEEEWFITYSPWLYDICLYICIDQVKCYILWVDLHVVGSKTNLVSHKLAICLLFSKYKGHSFLNRVLIFNLVHFSESEHIMFINGKKTCFCTMTKLHM